jgi:ribosome-associated heat shock protein Hsp15
MQSVRIDKWLWAARFYKTRSLASKACDLGRVQINRQATKPAREIRVGEMLKVKTEAGEFTVEVLDLSEMRGPAPVAQALYRETDESREARAKTAADRKLMMMYEPAPQHRPTKRDRRLIHKFRNDR